MKSSCKRSIARRYQRFLTASVLVSLAALALACGSAPPPVAVPKHLEPAPLPLSAPDDQAERALRVRFYAGAAYRARVVGWEAQLQQVVAASSAILQEASGTRIELVESLDWKLSGGKLAKALQSLSAFDRGVDVDLVIGLIDAAPKAEDAYDELVAAEPLGKHAVVRSYNRLAESERLASSTASLSEATKEGLLDRRRRHKQALLVAHAVAMAFGVEASGKYSVSAAKLDEPAAAILKITIPAALAANLPDADRKSIWTGAISKLEALGAGPQLLEQTRLQAAGNPRVSSSEPAQLDELRSVDRETLASVQELLSAGSNAKAWELLEPLTELYPGMAAIKDVACVVAFARGASDALERCRDATATNSNNAQTWLRVGRLQLESEVAAALPALRKAGELLAPEDKGWGTLASAYRKLSLPSLAIEAASHAKSEKSVAATLRWAHETRSRYGSNVGVHPDSEGRYLVALKDGLKLVYKNDFKAANIATADLRSTFPQSIAGDLMDCEVGVRRRKYDAAKRSCLAVVAKQDENAWARYLLGVVSQREGEETKALQYFSEAIARDSGLKAAYQGLAKLYRKRSDARLDALKVQYKEHFGADLP